jgi:uncharacterized protein YlzI (FlbEa/FlbD family)
VILLTKLDKSKVLVSLENIKYIESTPDTLVRFVNGDMLIVCEPLDKIAALVEDFKIRCLLAANAGSTGSVEFSGGNTSWT